MVYSLFANSFSGDILLDSIYFILLTNNKKRIMETLPRYQRIVRILPSGFGQKRVTIKYYGAELTGHFTYMPDYDLYHSGERGWKEAGNRIYDTILRNISR